MSDLKLIKYGTIDTPHIYEWKKGILCYVNEETDEMWIEAHYVGKLLGYNDTNSVNKRWTEYEKQFSPSFEEVLRSFPVIWSQGRESKWDRHFDLYFVLWLGFTKTEKTKEVRDFIKEIVKAMSGYWLRGFVINEDMASKGLNAYEKSIAEDLGLKIQSYFRPEDVLKIFAAATCSVSEADMMAGVFGVENKLTLIESERVVLKQELTKVLHKLIGMIENRPKMTGS